jgi:hypothetical protein
MPFGKARRWGCCAHWVKGRAGGVRCCVVGMLGGCLGLLWLAALWLGWGDDVHILQIKNIFMHSYSITYADFDALLQTFIWVCKLC